MDEGDPAASRAGPDLLRERLVLLNALSITVASEREIARADLPEPAAEALDDLLF